MNSIGKKGTWLILALVGFLLLGGAVGCQNVAFLGGKTVTGDTSGGGQGEALETACTMMYQFDQIISLEPIKIRLLNVGVVKSNIYQAGDDYRGHVALGMEVGNVGDETVSFYPERIDMHLASGEILTAEVSISSDIGGVFPPRRVKKGFLLFPIDTTEPEAITEFTLKIGAPVNADHELIGEDLELPLVLE